MPDDTQDGQQQETVVVKKIFNEDLLPHALEVIRQDRVLKPGEVKGDNIADATITMAKMLGMIVGGGSSTGELEDLTIRTYSFTNAASGWNTFTFPQPFEDVPQVICSAEGEYEVQVQQVTAEKFQYRLVKDAAATLNLTKTSYWVHTAQSTSTSNMQNVQLVTDGPISGGGSASGDAVRIMCIAIEFGGDE